MEGLRREGSPYLVLRKQVSLETLEALSRIDELCVTYLPVAPVKLDGEVVYPAETVVGGPEEGRRVVKELYGDVFEETGLTEVDSLFTAHEIAKRQGCRHRTSGAGRHIWSEVEAWGRGRGVWQQPYCVRCGQGMNVTGDRAKKLGYFSNLLGRMKKELEKEGGKLADVQIRLIMREMTEAGMNDTYSVTGTRQREFFVETVEKYTHLTEADVQRLVEI